MTNVSREIRYSYSTPAECREHLETFWERMGRKDWRIRYAWLPVILWDVGKQGFVYRTDERKWLCLVVEVRTLWDNWVAYRDMQIAASDKGLARTR